MIQEELAAYVREKIYSLENYLGYCSDSEFRRIRAKLDLLVEISEKFLTEEK